MMILRACSQHPHLPQYLHVAGAAEHIRRHNLSLSSHAVQCSSCHGWHVLARPQYPLFLVTISRAWTRMSELRDELRFRYHLAHPTWVLLHGNAARGDQTAAGIWRSMGGQAQAMPADWDSCGHGCPSDMSCRRIKKSGKGSYCSKAGHRRNQEMVDTKPRLVLAFIKDGSGGASDCARRADEAGLKVVRFLHDSATGEVERVAT